MLLTVAVASVGATTACVVLPLGSVNGPSLAAGDCQTIFVTSNGFHTGVVLPAEAARTAGFDPDRAPWVEFGWGEDGAYRGERLTPRAAVGAMLGGDGVLHVAPLRDRPDRLYAEGVSELAVSSAGLASLVGDLGSEPVRDAEGRPALAGPGKGEGAVFYEARTTYRTWRTCNVWTADRLRRAGVSLPRAGSTLAPVLTRRLAGAATRGVAPVDKAAREAGGGAGTRGLVRP